MKFLRDDFGHRLLLAEAIRNFYMHPPAHVAKRLETAGKKRARRDELAEEVGGVTVSTISRLHIPEPPNGGGNGYPRNAPQVAEYLSEAGYFPPGGRAEHAINLFPVFFAGFNTQAEDMLADVRGEYVAFQYSNRTPDHVIAGRFSIGEMTDWRYAEAQESYVYPRAGNHSVRFHGVAMSDEDRNLYVMMREDTHRYPRFLVLDDATRPLHRNGEIESPYGLALSGARRNRRHFSPVVMHKMNEADMPDELIHKDELGARLPAAVADYLMHDHPPGPSTI